MTLPILLFYGFAFLGLVHSIIFSIKALKNNRYADLVITLFLLVQSLIILEYVFYWSGLNNPYHYLCNISLVLLFLFGPLLYLYVDIIFSEEKKRSNNFLHFIPAFTVFVLLLPYFFSTAELKLNHYKMIKYLVVDFNALVWLIMAHMVFYFVILLVKINRASRVGHIKNWLLLIVGLFGFYISCYVSYYIMIRYPWFSLTTDYFVSIGMCASIAAIIYTAFGKENILDGYRLTESLSPENIYFLFKESSSQNTPKKREPTPVLSYSAVLATTYAKSEDLPSPNIEREVGYLAKATLVKYKNSGLTTDMLAELAGQLKKLMQEEKLYRESELKLETLAAKLGIARHYVSQVINQFYGVNFFEYINLLRIEEAKQLLLISDKNDMNIIEVAYAVGYTAKNTFNSAFRRIVGLTPTEYRKRNKVE